MEINPKNLLLALAIALGFARPAHSAHSLDRAANAHWLRLLHFYKGKSEIDGGTFFLSTNGRVDANAELQATIEAFHKPSTEKMGPYDQHPQCAFPERFRFLKEQGLYQGPIIACPEFEKWRAALQAQSVTLIYASPYLGNPASMFGHTFLRLNSSSLADAGLSFDAHPSDDNALVFAWRGLTGGYPGLFSLQPYYTKIKTYSHLEDRDLWEFELALTPKQIDHMIAHLWELGSARFEYYFLDENCSYQLLSLLEVAEPNWNLREETGNGIPMTVPLDTVRAIEKTGGIRSSRMRLSQVGMLESLLLKLTPLERQRYEELRKNPGLIADSESVAVVDAWIEWQRRSQAIDPKLLLLRSKLSSVSTLDAVMTHDRPSPTTAHATSKIAVFFQQEESTRSLGLQFRPVLHDRLESDLGYIPHSSLIIGDLRGRFDFDRGRVSFDSLILAEVLNLRPWKESERKSSWLASAKVLRPIDAFADVDCRDCVTGQLQIGWGASAAIRDSSLLSLITKLRAEDWRLVPALETRLLGAISQNTRFEGRFETGWAFKGSAHGFQPIASASATIAHFLPASEIEWRLEGASGWYASRHQSRWTLSLGHFF